MNLNWYAKYKGVDFFIKDIILKYLVLYKVCEQLGLVYFYHDDVEEENVIEKPVFSEKIAHLIQQTEQFLDYQRFTDEQKGLFYLGALINFVARAQYRKEHKTKPILKKIHFQGMSSNDVRRLYLEVLEKLRQYNVFNSYSEALIGMLNYYLNFDHLEKESYSEVENVVFMMTGYAFMVGNRTEGLPKDEEAEDAESTSDTEEQESSGA